VAHCCIVCFCSPSRWVALFSGTARRGHGWQIARFVTADRLLGDRGARLVGKIAGATRGTVNGDHSGCDRKKALSSVLRIS